ncbi:hypothetical protein AVEN_84153-1 [Araneus ventricosus]|uniref:Uncharacterized protein n=1 Tax=Araneus ventricosus TaxID=182803 RepID=A0A4Y2SSM1_ARAVE|nr:hypothetical protein AVEN_84153-1 [Araneus ventricosus]
MSGINLEEYLTANDDLVVFSGVTEEDILSEITDEMENDDEEDDVTGKSMLERSEKKRLRNESENLMCSISKLTQIHLGGFPAESCA